MKWLNVRINDQKLFVFDEKTCLETYSISTAKNGVGEIFGSEKTPRGWHYIRAKIGTGEPINAVFKARRPTGEIYHPHLKEQFPNRDWILTRIFWLCGLEIGKNRLKDCDTQRRYIYIHGTPDETVLGVPGSKGCIRMANRDIITLFDWIPVKTRVLIEE